MHQTTRILMLALSAVLLLTVQAHSQQAIGITASEHGEVTADKASALTGETVTLTVRPAAGFRLKALMVEVLGQTDEADCGALTRGATPEVSLLVNLTQTGSDTYTFVMPERLVQVSAEFCDLSQYYFSKSTTFIPAGMLMGMTEVTDIWLPDTDEPVVIEPGGLTLDEETGSNHRIATIHTPLRHLDDYALMESLSEHYEAGRVKATVSVPHKYWTLSCGVDVQLPEGIRACIVEGISDSEVEITELEDASIVKSNNGVLLVCPDDNGHSYEIAAQQSAERKSGSKPDTGNAHSYEGNLLEPVIEDRHYDNGDCLILSANLFHPVQQEGDEVRIPACKAVLPITGARTRTITISSDNR